MSWRDPCCPFASNQGFNMCRPSNKENLCNRIKRVQESSKILQNVLDIASTLVKVMQICGVHECKATKAIDVIIYAFMHFDEVAEHPGGKCKKRIRKEEFYNDLMRDCGMTKAEAKLSYSIVKCAFKAFYHKQVINKYDAGFVDECEWKNAANRTINAFAQSGATQSEIEITGRRILCAYENYMCRLQAKKDKNIENVKKCACGHGPNHGIQSHPSEYSPRGKQAPCQTCTSCRTDPCIPPEPLLCGQLCCQIVCPPGSKYPVVVCRDPCGRTFLKVDGDRINFDPYIMECEARRAALQICPPSNMDRIKSLRESLKKCLVKDSDNYDGNLAEISKVVDKGEEELETGEIIEKPGKMVGDSSAINFYSNGAKKKDQNAHVKEQKSSTRQYFNTNNEDGEAKNDNENIHEVEHKSSRSIYKEHGEAKNDDVKTYELEHNASRNTSKEKWDELKTSKSARSLGEDQQKHIMYGVEGKEFSILLKFEKNPISDNSRMAVELHGMHPANQNLVSNLETCVVEFNKDPPMHYNMKAGPLPEPSKTNSQVSHRSVKIGEEKHNESVAADVTTPNQEEITEVTMIPDASPAAS